MEIVWNSFIKNDYYKLYSNSHSWLYAVTRRMKYYVGGDFLWLVFLCQSDFIWFRIGWGFTREALAVKNLSCHNVYSAGLKSALENKQ